MSERWKYQIKTGGLWGLIIAVIIPTLDLFQLSFEHAFLSRQNLVRTAYFIIVGVFLIGYLRWRKKVKSGIGINLPHNNSINK
ncbi:hypothetical protein RCH18_000284 [Flavobacterium sp. PL11]|nr:hypothetical protein [Flavobacterium sp. PL11]